MKLSKRRATLELDAQEVEILLDFIRQLRGLWDSDDRDDPVVARLSPAAYGEDGAQADYHELTAATLYDERTDRADLCTAELVVARETGIGRIDLSDPDDVRRWLQMINEMRLALGTRIGITDDGPEPPPEDTPEFGLHMIYHWLTSMQDQLVGLAMR